MTITIGIFTTNGTGNVLSYRNKHRFLFLDSMDLVQIINENMN